ncbi:MAG: histidinol-phosphatase HisJ family protein, partial [Bacillota bacterium]|nr:histidinol-phosphatase HisJ family protein [Bacillota bacterium]
MHDYHIHSHISDDGHFPMADMAEAALKKGLAEIAVTDHYDPLYPDPDFPFNPNMEHYHRELEQVVTLYEGRLPILRGIEIGIQHHALEHCRQEALSYGYDYIIGSFHAMENMDLCRLHLLTPRGPEELFRSFYRYMYNCLREYKDYDVVGHFNIIDRYAPVIPDYACCRDLIEDVLRLIIEDGKGLEINTSSFLYNMGDRTTPTMEILKLYRSLGGDILTTGSDAHYPKDVGNKLEFAEEMARSAGFRYLTGFRERKPFFRRF